MNVQSAFLDLEVGKESDRRASCSSYNYEISGGRVPVTSSESHFCKENV